MSNSKLVCYTKKSLNTSGRRNHKIDYITPHCVVGQVSVETLGQILYPRSRGASSNYGIGSDGRIGLYVDEKNRSWCSSSKTNDDRAITIECASDLSSPYRMNNAVYESLINLCVDICKRHKKRKLIWIPNKEKALSYCLKSDEMLITVHRWYANKSCPGEWLYSRLDDLCTEVNKKLNPVKPKRKRARSKNFSA